MDSPGFSNRWLRGCSTQGCSTLGWSVLGGPRIGWACRPRKRLAAPQSRSREFYRPQGGGAFPGAVEPRCPTTPLSLRRETQPAPRRANPALLGVASNRTLHQHLPFFAQEVAPAAVTKHLFADWLGRVAMAPKRSNPGLCHRFDGAPGRWVLPAQRAGRAALRGRLRVAGNGPALTSEGWFWRRFGAE